MFHIEIYQIVELNKSTKYVNEKWLQIHRADVKECISENQIQIIKWINSKE